jgi:hypothetical protein
LPGKPARLGGNEQSIFESRQQFLANLPNSETPFSGGDIAPALPIALQSLVKFPEHIMLETALLTCIDFKLDALLRPQPASDKKPKWAAREIFQTAHRRFQLKPVEFFDKSGR